MIYFHSSVKLVIKRVEDSYLFKLPFELKEKGGFVGLKVRASETVISGQNKGRRVVIGRNVNVT